MVHTIGPTTHFGSISALPIQQASGSVPNL